MNTKLDFYFVVVLCIVIIVFLFVSAFGLITSMCIKLRDKTNQLKFVSKINHLEAENEILKSSLEEQEKNIELITNQHIKQLALKEKIIRNFQDDLDAIVDNHSQIMSSSLNDVAQMKQIVFEINDIKNGLNSTDNVNICIEKGKKFEKEAYDFLKENNVKDIFYDVKIPSHNSEKLYTQCDIILVTDKIAFIIECKNWSGNIYGDWNYKNLFYANSIDINNFPTNLSNMDIPCKIFPNPIKQNNYQVSDFISFFQKEGIDYFPVEGIVLFSSTDTAKYMLNTPKYITTKENVLPYIRNRYKEIDSKNIDKYNKILDCLENLKSIEKEQ